MSCIQKKGHHMYLIFRRFRIILCVFWIKVVLIFWKNIFFPEFQYSQNLYFWIVKSKLLTKFKMVIRLILSQYISFSNSKMYKYIHFYFFRSVFLLSFLFIWRKKKSRKSAGIGKMQISLNFKRRCEVEALKRIFLF